MTARRGTPCILLLLLGCSGPPTPASPPSDSEASERDEIYQRMAYSIALQDWQSPGTNMSRGHNIAAVLVDPAGQVVGYGRNCNVLAKDTTHHAELRAMKAYLATTKAGTLRGFTIYTTLEPCAMCAGMMIQTEVRRVVYGQSDPDFGRAFERLALDTRDRQDGFPPYPRRVLSEPSASIFRRRLDEAYHRNPYPPDQGGLVGWLRSGEAEAIFHEASLAFAEGEARHAANRAVLRSAREFHQKIPKIDPITPE